MSDREPPPHDGRADTARADNARAVVQRLESLRRAGVTDLRRVAPVAAAPAEAVAKAQAELTPDRHAAALPISPPAEAPARRSAAESASSVEPTPPPLETARPLSPPDSMPPQSHAARCTALAALQGRVSACTRCTELAQTRTQTVFGVGNPQARLVFLGEAPGADEDRQGEPFVGRAGKLLNDIINACTFRREDVYILNILKCRPPGNRNPSPQEADNCEEYLHGQLDIIQPEYICCLGAVAATNLLQTTAPIGKLRGSFHDYRGIKVVATYHPAYLLRNPAAKRHTWDDMKMLLRDMGVEIPDHTKNQSPKR
ncbi:MAG: uracil-DNA glycosylase [Pirellulaceae bacterium]